MTPAATSTTVIRSRPALLAAIACSAVGVAMSAVASIDSSVPGTDRWILAAANIGVTLAAHTLLTFSRRPAALLVWLACVGAVVYGHVTFVAGTQLRAGQQRATAVQATAEQVALAAQLSHETTRSASTVAAILADTQRTLAQAQRALAACTTSTPSRCATAQGAVTSTAARANALQIELTSAQRADTLRERLGAQAVTEDHRRAAATADPAAAAIASAIGLDTTRIQAAATLIRAMLIELLAVVLWQVAVQPIRRHDHTTAAHFTDWPASTAHHPLVAAQVAARNAGSKSPDPRDGNAHAGRGVPHDLAGVRAADRLHRARPRGHDLARHPAHRLESDRPDDRQQTRSPAQARRDGDGLGHSRPSAVDTG